MYILASTLPLLTRRFYSHLEDNIFMVIVLFLPLMTGVVNFSRSIYSGIIIPLFYA